MIDIEEWVSIGMVFSVCAVCALIIIPIVTASFGEDVSYLPDLSMIYFIVQIVGILILFAFFCWFCFGFVPERIRQIDRKYARRQKEIDERFAKYQEKK